MDSDWLSMFLSSDSNDIVSLSLNCYSF